MSYRDLTPLRGDQRIRKRITQVNIFLAPFDSHIFHKILDKPTHQINISKGQTPFSQPDCPGFYLDVQAMPRSSGLQPRRPARPLGGNRNFAMQPDCSRSHPNIRQLPGSAARTTVYREISYGLARTFRSTSRTSGHPLIGPVGFPKGRSFGLHLGRPGYGRSLARTSTQRSSSSSYIAFGLADVDQARSPLRPGCKQVRVASRTSRHLCEMAHFLGIYIYPSTRSLTTSFKSNSISLARPVDAYLACQMLLLPIRTCVPLPLKKA